MLILRHDLGMIDMFLEVANSCRSLTPALVEYNPYEDKAYQAFVNIRIKRAREYDIVPTLIDQPDASTETVTVTNDLLTRISETTTSGENCSQRNYEQTQKE